MQSVRAEIEECIATSIRDGIGMRENPYITIYHYHEALSDKLRVGLRVDIGNAITPSENLMNYLKIYETLTNDFFNNIRK